jgi:D-alanyl-D-alanine carboxypeptidase
VLLLVFIALGLLLALIGRIGAHQQASPSAIAAVQEAAQSSSPPKGGGLFAQTATGPTPAGQAVPTVTPMATPVATPIPAPTKTKAAGEPSIGAVSAVVIDDASGAVLYAKNAHMDRAPASITKIVTEIVALEHGQLDDMVTVQYDANELVDSTLMGVNPGDRLTLEDLLYGLMLPSGNDAALAIANYIAGSEEAFANMMNAKMANLGLTDSHFVNAHGLDARNHYTSAYDITMIARYAMRNPTFQKLVAAQSHSVTIYTPSGMKRSDMTNLNRLLTTYGGADGVKVGYTDNALRTFVGSAVRNGHRVLATVLGSNDLWTDTPPLLDYAFKNFTWPDGTTGIPN